MKCLFSHDNKISRKSARDMMTMGINAKRLSN